MVIPEPTGGSIIRFYGNTGKYWQYAGNVGNILVIHAHPIPSGESSTADTSASACEGTENRTFM